VTQQQKLAKTAKRMKTSTWAPSFDAIS